MEHSEIWLVLPIHGKMVAMVKNVKQSRDSQSNGELRQLVSLFGFPECSQFVMW